MCKRKGRIDYQQYKTSYVELTFARPKLLHFLVSFITYTTILAHSEKLLLREVVLLLIIMIVIISDHIYNYRNDD